MNLVLVCPILTQWWNKKNWVEFPFKDAGLEVDGALEDGGDGVNFIKLHAPLGTLKKYAEILKMKLPLKVRHNL